MKNLNLIAGVISTSGHVRKYRSPISEKIRLETNLLSKGLVKKAFTDLPNHISETDGLYKNLLNLSKNISLKRKEFQEQIIIETGYSQKDVDDIIDGTIELLKNFEEHVRIIKSKPFYHPFSITNKSNNRRINIISVPYGIVSLITPRNTPLIMEVIGIANALATNNSIVIRPSIHISGTVSLLIECLSKSFNVANLKNISIIFSDPNTFINTALTYSDLIHFIGSNVYSKEIIEKAIKFNRNVLSDGEGGSILVIDKGVDLDRAVEICRNAIIRCNGQLCTTAKGIIVHESIATDFYKKIIESLGRVNVDNPLKGNNVQMGPVFNEKQVNEFEKTFSSSCPRLPMGTNYVRPCLFKIKKNNFSNLKNYTFGPFTWFATYKNEGWKKILNLIPYSLTNTLISKNIDFQKEFINFNNSPRIVINTDPSEESVFEPWGAYLPNGFNKVSYWLEKYLKSVQIDEYYGN
jgi:acyl-CoA reductase-like NAD-dependent aldehyde dehydrogenase